MVVDDFKEEILNDSIFILIELVTFKDSDSKQDHSKKKTHFVLFVCNCT